MPPLQTQLPATFLTRTNTQRLPQNLFYDSFSNGRGIPDRGYEYIQDPNNVFSVADGVGTINGTPVIHDHLAVANPDGTPRDFNAVAGLCARIKLFNRTTVTTSDTFGWRNPDDFDAGHGVAYASANVVRWNSVGGRRITLSSGAHELASILRPSGARLLAKDGSNAPVLVAIAPLSFYDAYQARIEWNGVPHNYQQDDWRVDYFPIFAGDGYEDAVVHATPTSGTRYTVGSPNGIFHQDFVLPDTAHATANMVAIEVRTRVSSDGLTYITYYIKRDATNSIWTLAIDSVENGVATNRLAPQTGITIPSKIMIDCAANLHDFSIITTNQIFVDKTATNRSITQVQTGNDVVIVADPATRLGDFAAWLHTNPLYDQVFDFVG